MAEKKPRKKPLKARLFNMAQYEVNPVTHQPIGFTEADILSGVNHKSIARYAYILHDRDPYTEVDAERMKKEYGLDIKPGDLKPPHWHIVLECSYTIEISVIATWFNLPENQIDIPDGRKNPFLDCVEYLRHTDIKQKEAGKFEYAASDVKANFDWEAEIETYVARKSRYGRYVSDKRWYRDEVASGRMTPSEVYAADITAYTDDFMTLDRLHSKYIAERAPMPETRINYYIDGKGGVGKSLLSRALARNLYPDKADEDIFFIAGAKGAAFEGYMGQPVIIWDDRRAVDLLMELGGRGNVFALFDPHPARKKQNIKYSSIVPINAVNIINGIQPYTEFLDELSGEYTDKAGIHHEAEDKTQAYRRIPFIMRVSEDDIILMLNKGWLTDGSYREYTSLLRVSANMRQLAERCGVHVDTTRQLESRALAPVIEEHKRVVEKSHPDDYYSDEAIEEWVNANNFGSVYTEETWADMKNAEYITNLESEFQDACKASGHYPCPAAPDNLDSIQQEFCEASCKYSLICPRKLALPRKAPQDLEPIEIDRETLRKFGIIVR